MNNTAGSILLRGAQVPRDATAVAKLRDAGAIILGKTNMGEWAEGRSSNATSGWSSHGGQTYAAYCQKQSPGGSSSGSGVAVDLGLSFAALGTETAGSIIFPSHKNGIVGIKPTVGLTSRHMVVPLNEYQDTVGPMTRTVQDAAIILQIIAGHDTRDNYTSAIPEIPDYLAACKKGALRGARIGVPWNVLVDNQRPLDEEMDMFRLALKDMENEGATIVDANFTSGLDVFNADALRVAILASINTGLSRYLAELTHNPNGIKTLEDISQQTKQHPMTRYPRHNTLIFDIASEQGINTTHSAFWPARQEVLRLAGEEGLFGALDRFNLDAVVLPSAVSSSFPAYLGSPVISVPMGHYHESTPEAWDMSGELVLYGPNVPVGLSFLGRKWDESKLIGLAYSYEQKTKVRDSKVPRVIQPKSEVHISRQFLAKPE
ncbi:hypothetical protein VHEMI08692 [[Torrubiella] hemipterigena]|nr:hypothetical protein VHEMI08692 [[Torrubiella] hemipterigena]